MRSKPPAKRSLRACTAKILAVAVQLNSKKTNFETSFSLDKLKVEKPGAFKLWVN
jgi:hypothetical protein